MLLLNLLIPSRQHGLPSALQLDTTDTCGLPIGKGLAGIEDESFLIGLFSLSVLEGSAEDEVHHEHLVSDDDGEEEDGVVLRLPLQVVYVV